MEAEKKCNSILVVEDDEPIRVTMQQILEFEGYKVFTAGDGKEGLEVLQKIDGSALILLDLMLPVMSGWEFLDALRKLSDVTKRDSPVVIVSAAGEAAKTALERAQGFLRKPVDIETVLGTVAKYCQFAH
jgi:CheY-like chemotaxis protein